VRNEEREDAQFLRTTEAQRGKIEVQGRVPAKEGLALTLLPLDLGLAGRRWGWWLQRTKAGEWVLWKSFSYPTVGSGSGAQLSDSR
jgi:hypothetical protein